MANTPDAAGRLGELVKARLDELGYTLARFQREHDVSDATLRNVIRGGGPPKRADVRSKLARGLEWDRTSFELIEFGGDPIPTSNDDQRAELARLSSVEDRLAAVERWREEMIEETRIQLGRIQDALDRIERAQHERRSAANGPPRGEAD